jgi:hypothetical protein
MTCLAKAAINFCSAFPPSSSLIFLADISGVVSSFTGHTGRSTLRIVEDRDMAALWVVGAFPLLVGAFPLLVESFALLVGASSLLVEVILRREKEPWLLAKNEMESDFSPLDSRKLLGRFMAVMPNVKSRGRLIDEGKLRGWGWARRKKVGEMREMKEAS